MKIRFIHLEGSIGAGKTTLFNKLKISHPHFFFIDEPVEEFGNMLQLFYRDPKRWAFTFQMKVLMCQVKRLNEVLKVIKKRGVDATIISDRSLETNKEIFASMLCIDGLLTVEEFELYLDFYMKVTEDIPFSTWQCLKCFIDTPPAICYERIQQRGRAGEDEITMEYLNTLDQRHHNWLDSEQFYTFEEILKIL